MSKIALPALYQTDTFGSSYRHNPFEKPQANSAVQEGRAMSDAPRRAIGSVPARSPDFLVQLMVGGDQDLRKVIGRRDVAERREGAYGNALAANRRSRKPDLALLLEVKA
jgi:hypothetical protein